MLTVQDVKDTFYAGLRDRVAAGNAARTIVVRGVVRPGVLVVENELAGAAVDGITVVEAFCLRWTGLVLGARGLGLIAARCEIRYASDGTQGAAGMDRGRGLTAMDVELAKALQSEPRSLEAMSFSEAGAIDAGSRVFWGDVTFGPAVMRAGRMERTAEVEVYGYGD